MVNGLPLAEGRWSFHPFYWGQIHGWMDQETKRGACVERGPDSLERAKALVAAHPDTPGPVVFYDEFAAWVRRGDWRDPGDDDS